MNDLVAIPPRETLPPPLDLGELNANQIRTLYAHSRALLTRATLPELFRDTLDTLAAGLGVPVAYVAQLSTETESATVLARSGEGAPEEGQVIRLPVTARQWDRITKEPFHRATRIAASGDGGPGGGRIHAVLLGWLRLPRGDTAVIVGEDHREQGFSGAEATFFDAALEQLQEAAQRTIANEATARENRALWDVKQAILDDTAHLDEVHLSDLLGKILKLVLQRTRTGHGVILLADEKENCLVIESRAVAGEVEGRIPHRLVRRKDRPSGISFWVYDNNKSYMTGDVANDPNYTPLFKDIRSSMAVPIPFQGRCIGVIIVESPVPNAFDDEDLRALENLAKSVTVVVRRAQLFEETARQAPGHGIMILGLSKEWLEVERRVEKASATDAMVMLRGESGTGKELVAHAIHFNSPRQNKPFVVVNCAAIPSDLLESELFGHTKGSFTGAMFDKVGEFERAQGGTLFLDEIGDIALPLQAKLLRVLQSGEIQKIGETGPKRKVQVRVIAATSRDLETMMAAGKFREDLYYRLHVVTIRLPPLRDYRESIPRLVQVFVSDASANYKKNVQGLTNAALHVLMHHDFQGNVRELRHIIESAVIMCDGEFIDVKDLPAEVVRPAGSTAPAAAGPADVEMRPVTTREFIFNPAKPPVERSVALAEFEQKYLKHTLQYAGGNVSKAAELAGIHRVNFYALMRKYGVRAEEFRRRAG